MAGEATTIHFKLADLGVAKLFQEVDAQNTRAQWMLPPEVLRPDEFGPIDYRIDLYHVGLLFLQLAHSRVLTFTTEEVLAGKPTRAKLRKSPPSATTTASAGMAARRAANRRFGCIKPSVPDGA